MKTDTIHNSEGINHSSEALGKIKILKENLNSIKKQFKVKRIAIFGSYSMSEQRPDSDIDIMVEFDKTPGFFKFLELQDSLENLLQVKVDLSTPKSFKKAIEEEIVKDLTYI